MNIKMINEYSFHEFLASFQEAVIDGWRLDLSSNELFPQRYGSHLSTGMVKPVVEKQPLELTTEQQAVPEAVPEVTSETVTPAKTRKGK